MHDEEQDFCQWKRCKKRSAIVYLGKGLCDKHWDMIAEMDSKKAHKTLKIKEPPKQES